MNGEQIYYNDIKYRMMFKSSDDRWVITGAQYWNGIVSQGGGGGFHFSTNRTANPFYSEWAKYNVI